MNNIVLMLQCPVGVCNMFQHTHGSLHNYSPSPITLPNITTQACKSSVIVNIWGCFAIVVLWLCPAWKAVHVVMATQVWATTIDCTYIVYTQAGWYSIEYTRLLLYNSWVISIILVSPHVWLDYAIIVWSMAIRMMEVSFIFLCLSSQWDARYPPFMFYRGVRR